MRDGQCVTPPMFSRDTVIEYLHGKVKDYETWATDALADGDERFAKMFRDKELAARTILADIAAMRVE